MQNDAIFQDKAEFCRRTICTLANSGAFSSDKTISKLCSDVWKVESVEVPKPTLNPNVRYRSQSNLNTFNSQEEFNSQEFNSKGSIDIEDEDP
mmetsp:Transcript_43400/g.31702  ORF Transcript_43400/g.31702 Transcript_43400/m.31702 type:complete len:93 (-) Transcript_43400:46-324(-)